MPTVRNLEGYVSVRGMGSYEGGQTYEVSRDEAEYLTQERDFIYVKDAEGVTESDSDGEETAEEDSDAQADPVTGGAELSELTHDELKELAEERGIAEEIDLRSKESIIDALED